MAYRCIACSRSHAATAKTPQCRTLCGEKQHVLHVHARVVSCILVKLDTNLLISKLSLAPEQTSLDNFHYICRRLFAKSTCSRASLLQNLILTSKRMVDE